MYWWCSIQEMEKGLANWVNHSFLCLKRIFDWYMNHNHWVINNMVMQNMNIFILDSNDYTFLFSHSKSMSTRRAVLTLYKRALRVSQNCPDSIMRRKVRFVEINNNIDVLERERSFWNKPNTERCKANRMAFMWRYGNWKLFNKKGIRWLMWLNRLTTIRPMF